MSTEFRPALLIIDVQEDFLPPNGALAVPDGRSILPTINTLLSLPFPPSLKLATKDHHPPTHISFHTSPSHHAASPPLQPFTSTITITNPSNPAETYISQVWPPHCIVDTPGNALADGLDVDKIGRVVLKGRDERVEMYSAFRTPLRDPPLEEPETVDGEVFGIGELGRVLCEEKVTDVIIVGLAGDYCVKASAFDCVAIGKETRRGWRTWIVEEGVRSVGGDKIWTEARKELESHGVQVVGLQDVKKRFFPDSA